jgi:hypothetical protein
MVDLLSVAAWDGIRHQARHEPLIQEDLELPKEPDMAGSDAIW